MLSGRAFNLIQASGLILGFLVTLSGHEGFFNSFGNNLVLVGAVFLAISLLFSFGAMLLHTIEIGINKETFERTIGINGTQNSGSRSDGESDSGISDSNTSTAVGTPQARFKDKSKFRAWLIYSYTESIKHNITIIRFRSVMIKISMTTFLFGIGFLALGAYLTIQNMPISESATDLITTRGNIVSIILVLFSSI